MEATASSMRGVNGKEADVGAPVLHRLQGLARRVKAEQLHRNVETSAELVGDIDPSDRLGQPTSLGPARGCRG